MYYENRKKKKFTEDPGIEESYFARVFTFPKPNSLTTTLLYSVKFETTNLTIEGVWRTRKTTNWVFQGLEKDRVESVT